MNDGREGRKAEMIGKEAREGGREGRKGVVCGLHDA